MMSSQKDWGQTPHIPLPAERVDIMDIEPEACGVQERSTQQHGVPNHSNSLGASWNLNIDAEIQRHQGNNGCDGQLAQPKHQGVLHRSLQRGELETDPSSTIQHNSNGWISHGLDDRIDCLDPSRASGWPGQCHEHTTIHQQALGRRYQKPFVEHGLDTNRGQADPPLSALSLPSQPVKEDPSFEDVVRLPKQDPTTESTTTAFMPFETVPGAIEKTSQDTTYIADSVHDFGSGWPAMGAFREIDSAPPIGQMNTRMQNTVTLKTVERSWWDAESFPILGSNGWTDDMNCGSADLLVTRKDVSIDSLEKIERWPSPYDNQHSPISSLDSSGFTSDATSFAQTELEIPIMDDRRVPLKVAGPNSSQSSTTSMLTHIPVGYVQADKTAQKGAKGAGCRERPRKKLVPQRSSSRDEFLVRSKCSGMSYKEIKEKGNFEEAESTLRGRFRTLTKRKELRVRRPEWKSKDVSSTQIAPQRRASANHIGEYSCNCFALLLEYTPSYPSQHKQDTVPRCREQPQTWILGVRKFHGSLLVNISGRTAVHIILGMRPARRSGPI